MLLGCKIFKSKFENPFRYQYIDYWTFKFWFFVEKKVSTKHTFPTYALMYSWYPRDEDVYFGNSWNHMRPEIVAYIHSLSYNDDVTRLTFCQESVPGNRCLFYRTQAQVSRSRKQNNPHASQWIHKKLLTYTV